MTPTPSRGDKKWLAQRISKGIKGFPTYKQREVLAETKPGATVVGKKRGRSRREGKGNKRNVE